MQFNDDRLVLSATDLSNFLACRRKTALELSVARGERQKPDFEDPILEILRKRGAEHEARYVETERQRGFDLVDVSVIEGVERPTREARVAKTLDAMRRGVARIVQGALVSADGRWFGYADVLRRVEKPGRLGPDGAASAWSYEALDTKLAEETRAATMLQLSLYSELLADAQGVAPEFFHVVTPAAEGRYRVTDYAAYFRLMKRRLLEDPGPSLPYPEPVSHCDICDWRVECTKQLRADDHLSFVANCSRLQRLELATHDIVTLEHLGRAGLPEPFRPSRGAPATYQRLQHQARLQLESRDQNGAPIFETLPVAPALGLCLLPEPSPGDIFLDLEGATFARDGGREYLFGLVSTGAVYESFRAFDDTEEQRAFEAVIDRIIATLDVHPVMHVYHYAPYEPSAFKKLMGRYATRGPELDRLLRGERFVDLYAVIRHAFRAGVERYSIKDLEVFYGYNRDVKLDEAGRNRRLVEQALDLGSPHLVKQNEFDVVVAYNRDDCVSALRLRDWLEALRTAAIARGDEVPRPELKSGEAPEKVGDLEKRARDLRAKLLEHFDGGRAFPGSSVVESRPGEEEASALWLLSYLLDWHTREMKASWWEYYRLRDLPPEDQADEPMVVIGLEFLERVDIKLNKRTGKPTGTVTDRYRYADRQEMEIDEDESLTLADETDWGKVVGVDRIARTIDVQKGPDQAEHHAQSAFSFFNVSTDIIQKSVLDFGDDVLAHGLDIVEPRRDLLLRRPPQGNEPIVLAVQGPPGTGKTYLGGEMICDLVRAGKKVGVLANSHKVIRNLLKSVQKEAAKRGETVRVAHRTKDEMNDGSGILELDGDTKKCVDLLRTNSIDVLGGVAWTWASDKDIGCVEALVVDEAGQMSLASVLGAARAARRLILLGDPQQLDQPSKASHPDGVSVSALEHILQGERTMPPGRGMFLPRTRRLCPDIAAFTSEAFYEGRIETLDGLENQRLAQIPPLDTGALWVLPVEHSGNRSYSTQEVDAVVSLVERLLSSPASWIDRDRNEKRITAADILVVSPYNAQVSRLQRRLSDGAPGLQTRGIRVGTVDKFQGQEAPIVIYSMASSTATDAPRGMDFLYSLNRLNVATSRAQCLVIIVASPALFEPGCGTPRQMQLANALARFREMALTCSG